MTVADRLAPALRHLAGARISLAPEDLAAVRSSLDQRRADAVVDTTGVDISENRAIGVRVYRVPDAAGAVIYCHSGAFVLGNLDTDHRQCVELARRAGVAVYSVDYRLSPENPCPAALDDALSVLRWAAESGGPLAIAGSSAGAALAARAAQLSATGEAPPVVFQLLHQPVLDDRPTPSKREFTDTPGVDAAAVAQMWTYYLAGAQASADSAPGRAEDLSGLCPALITCSELDPLRDEALDYGERLRRAGVAAEVRLYPGTCHGFDSMAPDWEVSRQLWALQASALREALG